MGEISNCNYERETYKPLFFVLYLKVTPVANMFHCLYMLMYIGLILSTNLGEPNAYFAGCIKIPKRLYCTYLQCRFKVSILMKSIS